MKKYFLTAAAAILLAGFVANGQDNQRNDRDSDKQENREENIDEDIEVNEEDLIKEEGNRAKDLGDRKQKQKMKLKDGKMREYDEIIIKRKVPGKDSKVTIEIKDDQVIVDGKPIDKYVDEQISVQKRSMNRFKMAPPPSAFRYDGGDWMLENGDGFGEERAFLGIMTEGSSDGARVQRVTENSAAAKAGLKEGDVITRINDKTVFDHEQLSNEVKNHKPGDKVTITYKRNGKENKVTATLGKRMMPDISPRFQQPNIPPMLFNFDENHDFENIFEMRNRPRLGIKAQDTEEGKGVKVLEVEEGSAAAKAGIRENDIITSFEGKDVNSASELARASREASDKSTLKVQLKRNGKPQTIEVKVPKKLKTANL